jgi:hypothetical protein
MSEARRAREFARRTISGNVSQATRGVSLRVLTGVVLMTPVLTGRARGNWFVGIGSATGRRDDNARDPGGNKAIASGTSVIAAQRAFQQIILDNNLPYITKLNDGSSNQAPDGIVDIVIAGMGMGVGRE